MTGVEAIMFILGVLLQWVLEVLGAGGACWGMSEVWHLRGDTVKGGDAAGSNHDLRYVANVVFCLGFIRMFMKYGPDNGMAQAFNAPHEWLRDYGASKRTVEEYNPQGAFICEIPFFVLGVFLQWVLEVLGAGGATWGMSEVWHLRGGTVSGMTPHEANTKFRWVANITFTVAAFRMMQKYCPEHPIHVAINAPHEWLRDLGKDDKSNAPVVRELAGNIQA